MQFTYYAKKISGEEMSGEMEAKDRFELALILRQKGYTLVSFKEKREREKFLSFLFSFGGVSISEKMLFGKNLGVMISSGLAITRSLEILSRQTKNKKFKKILLSLMERVQKGVPLSEAMKDYPRVFDSLFVAMAKVGEESGKLSESLKIVSEHLEQERTLNKKIKGAMIYPAIIIVAMIVIGILMLIYVVPTLVSTFKELNVQLPLSTQIIISISNFLVNNTILVLGIIIFLILVIFWFFRTERGKRIWGNISLRLPFFSSLIKKIYTGRTSRTLASLISSGVNILDALSITQDVLQNYRYKQVLENARNEVQKGVPLSESFKKAKDLYPILLGEMLAVGEETGKISEMLNRIAAFYEEDVAETTKDLTTVIEPLLMVIVGIIVGFFAISMIKPMYSMLEGV
ncbi:MAG: type II secretion system F family protein [Candidatus Parcubacteria bacterium]|nr:type II secretion system F family protein [Candidatus Parcubacteria bacterium]